MVRYILLAALSLILVSCDTFFGARHIMCRDNIEVLSVKTPDTILVYKNITPKDAELVLRQNKAIAYVCVSPTQEDFLHWYFNDGFGCATMHDMTRLFGVSSEDMTIIPYLCAKTYWIDQIGFRNFENDIKHAASRADNIENEIFRKRV